MTVSLIRNSATVATSAAATTNASGEWSASLGAHAPADALDVVNVKYTGSGAPAEASYGDAAGFGTSPGLGFFEEGMSIAEGGATGGVLCTNFAAVTCASVVANVAYSGGGTAEDVGKPDEANEEIEEFAFSPAVGPNDTVTVTASFTEENGSTFELTVPAPLPGVGDVFAGEGVESPRCSADLVTLAVSCAPLAAGSYTLTQTRGATNLGSHSATVGSGGEATTFTLSSLQAGDDLALAVAGAGGRTLSTLHVYKLVIDVTETLSFGAASSAVTGGTCEVGEWFGGTGGTGVCPSNGVVPAASPEALEDELSGGATTVTPPLITYTSPQDGEDVSGPSLAVFAELTNAATTAVAMGATPVGGGSTIPATGNANSAGGATLTGLTAGTRYAAAWSLTDANTDAVTMTTHFVDQAGGSTEGKEGKEGPTGNDGAAGKEGAAGTEGAPGKEGPTGKPGAAGPEGKTGPPGAAAEIVCTTHKIKVVVKGKKETKTKTTCVVKMLAPGQTITGTSLSLLRGSVVYAVGRASAASARVRMRDVRKVTPGVYTLRLVVKRDGAKTVQTMRVRVSGGR